MRNEYIENLLGWGLSLALAALLILANIVAANV